METSATQAPATANVDEDLDRKAEEPAGYNPVDHVIRRTGPGRKPRACSECKKQKMKCEVLPGDSKCKNCLRRGVECIMNKVVIPDINTGRMPWLSAETY
ncbi:hypothetical protein GGR56DRAFT_612167, partial [Xylariaceae sp. FL0804]